MNNFITADATVVNFGVNRGQAIAILKAIADKKVADFRCGRKGWPTRLERKVQR